MGLRSVLSNQIRGLTISLALIALTVVLAVVLFSVTLLPDAGWTIRLALGGFCILAAARPADAFLVASALVGFGIILSHLAGVPSLRVTDVLVATTLMGFAIHAIVPGSRFRAALARSVSPPIVLFAVTAIASTICWLRVDQVQAGQSSAYLQAFFHFATRDYFVQPGEFWLVVSTVAMLQGLALFVVSAACCRADPDFFLRALRMLSVGGAGLAMMSIVRVVEILLRNPHALAEMRATYDGLRISPQIPDYIAAGSYFSLCWLVSLGLAIASARRRLVWVAVSVPLVAALYLTGSRSVVAAAVGGVVVLGLISFGRRRAFATRGVIAIAIIAVAVMIVGFRWMVGHDIAGTTARASLSVRAELLRVGLRVIETRPLFGVGIDRFFLVAGTIKSPLLEAAWASRRNPHNDFLRFAAELGVVGLALFLGVLLSSGVRVWQALRHRSDPPLAGLAAGLVAFLITSVVSNPLIWREVSYVFWVALGLAVGRSATLLPVADRNEGATTVISVRRMRTFAAWLLGGVLLVSIPFRTKQELATVDPARVSYGLSDWEIDSTGSRFRWSGPRVTLYVSGRARRVEIPLRGTLPSGSPQHVELRLDGRLVNEIAVGREWQRVGVVLPTVDLTSPRRLELTVSPTWVRTDEASATDERTVVGVKVGELNVIR